MTYVDVRKTLVETLRRDLTGPSPHDADLLAERLTDNPARWYLTGYLVPAADPLALDAEKAAEAADDPSAQEEQELEADEADPADVSGTSPDREAPDAPNTRRRYLPSSVGITVLLPPDVTEVQAVVTWGDYRTVPPLPETILLGEELEGEPGKPGRKKRPPVEWVRAHKERSVPVAVPDGRGEPQLVPDSKAEQLGIGALTLEAHARLFEYDLADGTRERVRALTVFLVNRRQPADRYYADVAYAFQARLTLVCPAGFRPRRDLSGLAATDPDLRVADLHYRNVCEWAVGRNVAASWDAAEAVTGAVTRVWTDPLPQAEVERVAPNEDAALKARVTFGMEALADASTNPTTLAAALTELPAFYRDWIAGQRTLLAPLPPRRRTTAEELVRAMEAAEGRIAAGIALLQSDANARTAFRLMNLAIARAARQRDAQRRPDNDPGKVAPPTWRPFQLAFVLLNLSGLADRTHADREVADLLFFPTGGGKTEAYLGLAAFAIAHRRITGTGLLGAGVTVIMRYTLRLLTLDQLARAAGVVCALELMRDEPAFVDGNGRRMLGDWPIEIGLWVGSDASPNRLGGKGDRDDKTAVARVRKYRAGKDKRAPAPLKACPWCGTLFTKNSFACVPNEIAPTNLAIRCDNLRCDFTGDRALPILTVDEPIYRRLPAFLIATVDKFAALPWEGQSGAFFAHVDRQDETGFYGASEPGVGRRLDGGWSLNPPDLIIQDELHLIAGPLGTVAALYEAAIDQIASRTVEDRRVRPKIVASTATVRRAAAQIEALFDRPATAIFPPPGLDREDSFFARTVPASQDPARLYVGIAAQGFGPKLVYLRALTTLMAAAQKAYEAGDGADPYMTALCYFNALRELGGARRIVEDEVRDRVGRYGSQRRRADPPDAPFADREVREPLELTSRVSTDEVAKAKQRLEDAFGGAGEPVDVALATNMISVGLDITRLGLMLVQGQPKTAAEYIQATSRVGRDHNRPGLVFAVLNLHKPRDRMHYEQFGHFHRTFYRAVEATSVTPWAARALDRALAAVVVAAARHVDPALTADTAVVALKDQPVTRAAVRDAIVARAPAGAVAGGHPALAAQIDELIDGWIATAEAQTASGIPFAYAHKKSPQRLLHMPLEKEIGNLDPPHQRFQAGRSMRDVEPSVALKVRDPRGRVIENADDI